MSALPHKTGLFVPQVKVTLPKHAIDGDKDNQTTQNPNDWFFEMFPESAALFGPAFLQGVWQDDNQFNRFIPLEVNEDFFAHALGGDRRLGHRVVFYLPEQRWYFFDPTRKAFCVTSQEKLEALLSNYLVRCAQACGLLVDIRPMVMRFREACTLEKVITRAKALHAAEKSFFQGEHGNWRWVDGRLIEPTSRPCYVLFIDKAIVLRAKNPLTVTDAYGGYFQFCQLHGYQPLAKGEFKALMAETIREKYALALRRDVQDGEGKHQVGWMHLALEWNESPAQGLN